MKIAQMTDIIIIMMLIAMTVIRSSHQTVYSCNLNASCGCSRNSTTVSRIVGGEPANSSTWTWAVSISIANSYLCGGSIISPTFVITAAHCVYGYQESPITVYAGSTVRWSGTQSRTVSEVFVHAGFESTTYVNDIALLKLDSPLDITDPNLGLLCLPSVNQSILSNSEWPPVGTNVVAIGWGRLSESGSLPTRLQQVTLEIVDHEASTCTPVIGDWRFQLCAGVPGGGKDSCQGDSGGPLMMMLGDRWTLIGLVSSGIGCARPEYAGVYSRVAAYENWINSKLYDLNTTSSSSYSTLSTTSLPTTVSTTSISTTNSMPPIQLHAITVAASFFNVITFVLMLLFMRFFEAV